MPILAEEKSARDQQLRCDECKLELNLRKGEKVPRCPRCGHSSYQASAAETAPHQSEGASFPFVGSDVLDISGSGGAARREMHDIIHSADDEIAEHHLGPLEEASVSFRPDPEAGDAGADLADELGRSFLESATTGEDMSELESADDLMTSEIGGPLIEVSVDEGLEDATTNVEPQPSPPRKKSRRKPRPPSGASR